MKKWQLILCSMGASFLPTLVMAGGYSLIIYKTNWPPSIIPYLPLIIGALGSYYVYKNSEELLIDGKAK